MICNSGWQLFARDGSPAACSAVSLFIVGCVLTHLLEARAVRRAFYRLAGIVKVLTAAASPSVVTPKPANGGQGKTGQREEAGGLGCFILPPPVVASLFSYANSEDHI
jgi:hypothetical protein